MQQRAAASGNDALLDGGTGGIQGILDPQFAVLQFRFRRCTDLDHSHAAGQLGDSLLELFAVVFGFGGLQFTSDRADALAHRLAMVVGGDDRGALLADGDAARLAEILEGHFVEGHRLVFADQRPAREDGDIGEGCLAAFAKGGCPNSGHLQNPTALVHHQGGEGFAFHFLREDQQGRTTLLNRLQHGDQIRDRADLAIRQQDQGVFKFTDLTVGIRHEVGGAVAPVEGHAFGDFQFRCQRLRFLNRDHPIGAHLVHRLRDHPTDFVVTPGAHRGHLTNGIAGDGLAPLAQSRHDLCCGFLDATAKFHGACSRSGVAQTFLHHGLSQNGCGRGAVTGLVLGLRGHLLHQLGAEVFERVVQFDDACD